MLRQFYNTWYLSLGPGAAYLILAMVNGAKIKSVLDETNRSIRFERDLQLVRGVINQNMMWAIVIIVSYAIIFIAIWYEVASGGLDVLVAGFHFSALALLTYVGGRYSKRLEQELKSLRVLSPDPQISDTYRRWVRQWSEPRLRLPD